MLLHYFHFQRVPIFLTQALCKTLKNVYRINFSELHQFGVSHADDLYYNFDFSNDQCAQFSEQDFQVAYDLALFFTNFARIGDPNIIDAEVIFKATKVDGVYDYDPH